MLNKRQIKVMAKPYTNKTIINAGTKTVTGSTWWSNGHMVFLGELPKDKDYPKNFDHDTKLVVATEYYNESIAEYIEHAQTVVYPVEIRPNHSDKDSHVKRMTVLRFSNDMGLTIWANARYVAAIQKRHRGKQELTWTADYATGVMVAHNGKPVAMLMRLSQPEAYKWDKEPAWNLKNEYPPEEVV